MIRRAYRDSLIADAVRVDGCLFGRPPRSVVGHSLGSNSAPPYGCVTPAKRTRSATVKSPAVAEGRIGLNVPATFR